MNALTIKFNSMEDIIDFQMITDMQHFDLDPQKFTLYSLFTDAELELARNGYGAKPYEHFVEE
ncbi:hypothetical protein [Cnuella takakiae]|nr:hypothetical protein [Cnuella takakiae]